MSARYLLYIRQSVTADKDESLSLAFQERSLSDLVRKDGGVVIEPPIVDADEKGWDPHRPGITSLIERPRGQPPEWKRAGPSAPYSKRASACSSLAAALLPTSVRHARM